MLFKIKVAAIAFGLLVVGALKWMLTLEKAKREGAERELKSVKVRAESRAAQSEAVDKKRSEVNEDVEKVRKDARSGRRDHFTRP